MKNKIATYSQRRKKILLRGRFDDGSVWSTMSHRGVRGFPPLPHRTTHWDNIVSNIENFKKSIQNITTSMT